MTEALVAFVLGLALALAYLPFAAAPGTPMRSVLKTAPLVVFALSAWLAGGLPYLIAALAFSALGDLALSRDGRAAFLYGLASFALAHLLYILLFTASSGLPLWEALLAHPLPGLALILLAMSTELWLAPHAGRLAWPVRGYVLLIAGMGLAALALPASLWLASLGALLFIASDLILSIRLFRLPDGHRAEPPAARATWVLYIAGQALILIAFAAA